MGHDNDPAARRQQVFDGRQPPVAIASEIKERSICYRILISHLVAWGLLPHQPGIKIGDGAITIIPISRLDTMVLGILTVECSIRLWAGDFMGVAVAFLLAVSTTT